jgi:CheY-like chemotaxis protein
MPQIKPIILVVEDDGIVRLAAVDVVERAGFEAVEAGGADEAIKILEASPHIHLVFTDVEMPGTMDGIKLAHYIRDRWPPIKLIVASGRTIVEENSLPEGAHYFGKPYDEAELVRSIIRLVA